MIELAPHSKLGLALANPVMIASGCCGYGHAYRPLIDLSFFGAVVTQPITLRPRRGTTQPRLVETRAGFILDTGQQNPGVKKILRQYSKVWARLETAVIAHLPADEPDDLMRTVRALTSAKTPHGDFALAAFELGLPAQATSQEVEQWVKAMQDGSELPLLVKLPLDAPLETAEAAANVYADALVIGSPPLGAAFVPDQENPVSGHLYGPFLHSLVLHRLQQYADLGLPVVAVGGIHSLADAQAFFEAGAMAIQLDSLLFIDPKQAEGIAGAMGEKSQS
jgi:dihydroorotate dehydrogenase (NAD+) catalytic subunit